MKSAFRVGSPTGITGAQQIALSSIAGHPGVIKDLVLDCFFNGRNAAAATSPITVRTGRGGTISGMAAGGTVITGLGNGPGAFPEQPSGTSGNDDIDNLVNALFGTAVQQINLGVGRILTDQMTMVQLRTLFGVLNGGQDFHSRNLIDYQIIYPSSASGVQPYNLDITIPISLDDYVAGGEVFAQGTNSVRDGTLQLNFTSAASYTNVAGATINLTGYVYTLFANYIWEGDGSWVGPTWRATRQAYGGNVPLLKPGHYLFISDSSTQTGNGTGGAGFNATTVTLYNFHGQWNGDQNSPAFLRADFQLDRNKYAQMYDIGERTVPIITMDINDDLRRFPLAKKAQTVDASSGTVNNITLMVVEMVEKNPGIVASVAAIEGGGGATSEAHPPTAFNRDSIMDSEKPFAPSIQRPGALPSASVVSSPSQAATKQAATNITGFTAAARRSGTGSVRR